MPTWQPQDTEIEKLRKAIVDERSKYNEQDVVAALQRYPGSLGQIEQFPNRYTTAELIDSCLKGIQKDNDYHKLSFMLRLTEQKWDFEAFRTKLVTDLPAIVRPPRGFKEQIELVSAALGELIGRVPEAPNGTNIVDVATFERLCQRRSAIEAFAAALAELEALKSLHDSLHMLQVLGADWLAGAPTDPEREDTATVLALLRQIATVAGNSMLTAGDDETALRGRIEDAFANLRSGARTLFLLVDQMLRQDFAALVALRSRLQTILQRMPPYCGTLVETYRDRATP